MKNINVPLNMYAKGKAAIKQTNKIVAKKIVVIINTRITPDGLLIACVQLAPQKRLPVFEAKMKVLQIGSGLQVYTNWNGSCLARRGCSGAKLREAARSLPSPPLLKATSSSHTHGWCALPAPVRHRAAAMQHRWPGQLQAARERNGK